MANSKLFVSNLDFELTTDQIREIFAGIGSCVSLTLVKDRESGRSRGYAFVEMSSPEEAIKAIADLNGKLFNGRPISVAEDRGKKSGGAGGSDQPAGERTGGGAGGSGGGEERQPYQPLQPMQRIVFFKRKKKADPFMENPNLHIDYRDVRMLTRFLSERGRILPRRLTGLTAYNQRELGRAIKRSQNIGLLPFTTVG